MNFFRFFGRSKKTREIDRNIKALERYTLGTMTLLVALRRGVDIRNINKTLDAFMEGNEQAIQATRDLRRLLGVSMQGNLMQESEEDNDA